MVGDIGSCQEFKPGKNLGGVTGFRENQFISNLGKTSLAVKPDYRALRRRVRKHW